MDEELNKADPKMSDPKPIQNEIDEADDDPVYKELLEYFRSHNIITDPPRWVYPGRAKVTANGVVNVERNTDPTHGHVTAVLTLPDLKERASYSSYKWLYELSLKLADDTPPTPPTPPPPPPTNESEELANEIENENENEDDKTPSVLRFGL